MGFNKKNITLYGLHVHDDVRFSVGFLCRCCKKFPGGKFFSSQATTIKFFFPSKLWLNSFKIVVISLPWHRNRHDTLSHSAKLLILHETKLWLFYTKISFSFRSFKIYGNLDQLVLGTFLFAHSLHAGFQSGWTKEPLAGGPGTFKQSGHFLSYRIFSKAQKLLVCHKLVKCYSNLQDKLQLTTPLLRWEILIYVLFARTKDHILYPNLGSDAS